MVVDKAAAAIPSLQRYQRTVGSIYGYFSNSSSLQAGLKEMHVILDTDDVKLKSIHAVRWLSFGEAHVALHRTMHAVAEVFKQDAELMHDTMAETLAKAMLTYEFIGINSLLCDILGTIAITLNMRDLDAMSILDHLCPAGWEPIVDTDTCSTEWPPFKEQVHANYSKYSFQELVKITATQHAGFLPETTMLLAAISVIPMSTVPCECGFSVQNRIKTKGRARIKAENRDVLMRICIEGPPIEQFDFYRALEKF
ncbi:hypothetical protein F7725_026851 [Dissostichus mawsoni]|uniref:HAT C-terminal dimerisation domain-containing protein n=1 Tax=Dissostichus mawsoni TaxID=36200 RepID=A0A7J5X868_DISMA|nr:hypothetical protein F7725_026851 [Dissostichus mawsoni]